MNSCYPTRFTSCHCQSLCDVVDHSCNDISRKWCFRHTSCRYVGSRGVRVLRCKAPSLMLLTSSLAFVTSPCQRKVLQLQLPVSLNPPHCCFLTSAGGRSHTLRIVASLLWRIAASTVSTSIAMKTSHHAMKSHSFLLLVMAEFQGIFILFLKLRFPDFCNIVAFGWSWAHGNYTYYGTMSCRWYAYNFGNFQKWHQIEKHQLFSVAGFRPKQYKIFYLPAEAPPR